MDFIRQFIWAFRFKRAKRKADMLSSAFGLRYFVLFMGGKLKVVPKQNIKKLIKEKRFKSGTSIEDIEKRALYVTPIR